MRDYDEADIFEKVAESLKKLVDESGKKVAIDLMDQGDRRALHKSLSKNGGVRSYSVGEEPYRRLVIEGTKKGPSRRRRNRGRRSTKRRNERMTAKK